jgi:NADH dehydrogenase (ubiquinone) Fe-S protein 2
MRQSLFIIQQVLNKLTTLNKNVNYVNKFNQLVSNKNLSILENLYSKYNMEILIRHFKYYSEYFSSDLEETYMTVEAPKGEFGIYLLSNNNNKPYRCRIKAPGFLHLQGLDFMSKGLFLADLVAIIGTQDIVFGEVDR